MYAKKNLSVLPSSVIHPSSVPVHGPGHFSSVVCQGPVKLIFSQRVILNGYFLVSYKRMKMVPKNFKDFYAQSDSVKAEKNLTTFFPLP